MLSSRYEALKKISKASQVARTAVALAFAPSSFPLFTRLLCPPTNPRVSPNEHTLTHQSIVIISGLDAKKNSRHSKQM